MHKATAEEVLKKLRTEDYLAKLVKPSNENGSRTAETSSLAIVLADRHVVSTDLAAVPPDEGVILIFGSTDQQLSPYTKLKTFQLKSKMLFFNYSKTT